MTRNTLKLEELSWMEIKELLDDGWTNIIVPLGATEQHGPGLPLGVDTWHGEETAIRAAKLLEKTLVATAVPFGYSPEHTAFPGTLSVRKETLKMLLEDLSESLSKSGFKFIYFWFGHGGDWVVARECLPPLKNRWKDCIVTFTKDMAAYVTETWEDYPLKDGIMPEVSGSHAGEFEASMLAAIRPDLLKKERLEKGDPRSLNEILIPMMENGIHTISENGVLGDQRFADVDRGNRYLDVLATWLVQDFTRQKDSIMS